MSDWETQKKALLPYLQRAAEIEAVDPKVAYYCRLYAVEQGIKLEQRDQKADDLLELVLNQLEKDKPHLVLDTSVDLDHCEKFALNVYVKAKRRDEQGISDRDTAKAYYAAFNFIEILKQFGSLSPEVEKERRFAVFRAAEIKRCLDEGKEPPPLLPPATPVESEEPIPDRTEAPVQKPGGPPLIDYDPGYALGSKVLFMDGDAGSFRKGFIRGKAQEVGGFFNIEAEDGSERQLGALFLAPDLTDGGDVTYFFTDGRQMDAAVEEMHASEWPPIYSLKLHDGSTKIVNHSQFVMNSGPITAEEQQDIAAIMDEALPEIETETVKPPEEEEARIRPPIAKRHSWLVSKDSTQRRLNGSTSVPSVDEPSTSVNAEAAPAAESRPSTDLVAETQSPGHYPSFQNPDLTPQQYYADGAPDYPAPVVQTPMVTVTNYDAVNRAEAILPPAPLIPQRQSGFEPDTAAIQRASKCARNATAALNFNDVDHAIKCLQDALKCLTQPSVSTP